MRRGYTFAGGKRRRRRWNRRTVTCRVCSTTAVLDYQTDAETPAEADQDLYLAVRRAGWVVRIDPKTHDVDATCVRCPFE